MRTLETVVPEHAAAVIDPIEVDADNGAVATVRAHTSWSSRLVTLVAVVLPPAAFLSVAGVVWGVALSWLDVGLFAAFYVATGLGITVGFHRLFTHKSFVAATPVRLALAILGSMTLQGPLTQWVTDHRKHHARSDQEGDPHSPHLGGPGFIGAVRGLFHSHVGWLFSTKGMERGEIYGRDLFDDRAVRVIDRLYMVWVALSVGLPFLIAYLVTMSPAKGFEALVWAGLVRIFAFEHATFAVNSICHTFGRRRYAVSDHSRNNVLVAVLTFGEGWHNNHHAFPRSARHGLGRYELDVSWLVIRLFALFGLAHSLRLPTQAQRAKVDLSPV
jgi:stearoyl-CoA desaturase (delta-9 desaturase)